MKKLFLSLVAAIVAATATYAQSSLVATLTHGDNVSMFYGAGALNSAHKAAASGDIITLSAGTFTGGTITKAVTIRGAGMSKTIIDESNNGTTFFNIPETDTCRLIVECIRFDKRVYLRGTTSNALFNKCEFANSSAFEFDSNSYYENLKFANCKIHDMNSSGYNSVKLMHCCITTRFSNSGSNSSFQLLNCVVRGVFGQFPVSTFINCILEDTYGGTAQLPSGTIAMNCVAISSSSNPYANMQSNQVDCKKSTHEEMFSNTNTYELTDYAKSTFLGTDGTEVGLYGGQYPYNTTPSYPTIKKMNVAKQSTADDKLSVEIEVSAVEE